MKLFSTFLKDLKLSFRSYYIYIEIIMAVIFIAILLFVIPESFQSEGKMFVYIDLENEIIESFSEHMNNESNEFSDLAILMEAQQSGSINPEADFSDWPAGLMLKDSAEGVRSSMEENREAIGLLISNNGSKLKIEVVLQGYENEQMRNLMEKQFVAPLISMMPDHTDNIILTNISETREKLPDRINLLPVLLVLNCAFVGLFIIAAYIFMDKEEGTIKALAVTPTPVWQYLLSKVGVMLITGIITGSIIILSVAADYVNFGYFLILMIVFNLFGSALGLFIASFYDTLTKSLGTLYLVIIILSLTSFSYFMPAFSPRIITLLPSYPMLFALRETLLQKPDLNYIFGSAIAFAAISILLFLLANMRYKKTITI